MTVRRGVLDVEVSVVVDGDSMRASILTVRRRKTGEFLTPAEFVHRFDGDDVQSICLEAMRPPTEKLR